MCTHIQCRMCNALNSCLCHQATLKLSISDYSLLSRKWGLDSKFPNVSKNLLTPANFKYTFGKTNREIRLSEWNNNG